MQRALLLFSALLIGAANAGVLLRGVPQPDGRIVGGQAVTVEEYPYQVSVRLLGSHMCGGSIIAPNVVLTAAHCIYPSLSAYYSVQYGVTTIGGSQNVINAASVTRHEKYDGNVVDYDIALIVLQTDIPLGRNAQPIPLAEVSPAAGSEAIVTGWGTTTEGGVSSSVLQRVAVEVVAADKCAAQYEQLNDITDRMLCAGVPEGGKDACQGDSGGPLVVNGLLAGIVSWGNGCARADYAGVYSNVANLRSWVVANSP